MKKPQKVTISMARLEAFIEASDKLNEIFRNMRPKEATPDRKGNYPENYSGEEKVDWEMVSQAWTGVIDLHNNLTALREIAMGIELWNGGSFLFNGPCLIDNVKLLEIEKELKGITKI